MPFCSDNDIRCFSAPQTPKEKLQSTSQTGVRCVVAFGTLRGLPYSCTISPIALSSEDGTRCRGHCELNWPLGARNRDPSCGRLAQLHCPAMRHAVAAAGRVPWSASPYRPFFKHVTVTENQQVALVAGRSVAAALLPISKPRALRGGLWRRGRSVARRRSSCVAGRSVARK